MFTWITIWGFLPKLLQAYEPKIYRSSGLLDSVTDFAVFLFFCQENPNVHENKSPIPWLQ